MQTLRRFGIELIIARSTSRLKNGNEYPITTRISVNAENLHAVGKTFTSLPHENDILPNKFQITAKRVQHRRRHKEIKIRRTMPFQAMGEPLPTLYSE